MIRMRRSSSVLCDNDRTTKPQGRKSHVSVLVTGSQVSNLSWRKALIIKLWYTIGKTYNSPMSALECPDLGQNLVSEALHPTCDRVGLISHEVSIRTERDVHCRRM